MLKFIIAIEERPGEGKAININLHTEKERATPLEERFADRLRAAVEALLRKGPEEE